MILGELLDGDQGGAADGGALVLEPAAKQLELLAEAELADRPVGDRPLPVVHAARRGFDLFVPLLAQRGELSLVARLGELVRLRRYLSEGHGRVMLTRAEGWRTFRGELGLWSMRLRKRSLGWHKYHPAPWLIV
jgi:hypothetical protein